MTKQEALLVSRMVGDVLLQYQKHFPRSWHDVRTKEGIVYNEMEARVEALKKEIALRVELG